MANIDNITKGIAVGPVGGFTTDNGTLDVQTGTFGSLTKSNGLTDGTSVATASKNMAEIYNRVLLDAASALDLAANLGDPAVAGSIDDLLPAGAVDARDIEKNWAPITTLGYILGEGIKSVRAQAVAAQATANQAVAATGGYSFTGSIQFVKATNRIVAPGLGAGVELGDVLQVTGTVSNNRLYTVDVIIDANTVVVNEAHKNGAGTLSLNNETVTSTVKLVVKWHSAAYGLGQAWVPVNVTPGRLVNTLYTNGPRAMGIHIRGIADNITAAIQLQGVTELQFDLNANDRDIFVGVIPPSNTYKLVRFNSIWEWHELR